MTREEVTAGLAVLAGPAVVGVAAKAVAAAGADWSFTFEPPEEVVAPDPAGVVEIEECPRRIDDHDAALLELLDRTGPVTYDLLDALWETALRATARRDRLARLVRFRFVLAGRVGPPPGAARPASGRPPEWYRLSDGGRWAAIEHGVIAEARRRVVTDGDRVVCGRTLEDVRSLCDAVALRRILAAGGVQAGSVLTRQHGSTRWRFQAASADARGEVPGPYGSRCAGLPALGPVAELTPDVIFRVASRRWPQGLLVLLYDADRRSRAEVCDELRMLDHLVTRGLDAGGSEADPWGDVPGTPTAPQWLRPVSIWVAADRDRALSVLRDGEEVLRARLERDGAEPVHLGRRCLIAVERAALDRGLGLVMMLGDRPGAEPWARWASLLCDE